MTAYLDPELAELLGHTVDAHVTDPGERELVLTLCAEAIEYAREHGSEGFGQRARTTAGLLLGLARPDLDPELRHELAVACELAALGAAVRHTEH
jgi:hypothetical protein